MTNYAQKESNVPRWDQSGRIRVFLNRTGFLCSDVAYVERIALP